MSPGNIKPESGGAVRQYTMQTSIYLMAVHLARSKAHKVVLEKIDPRTADIYCLSNKLYTITTRMSVSWFQKKILSFTHYKSIWELYVAMTTRVPIQSAQNQSIQPNFPLSDDGFTLNLITNDRLTLEIHFFENLNGGH